MTHVLSNARVKKSRVKAVEFSTRSTPTNTAGRVGSTVKRVENRFSIVIDNASSHGPESVK